MRKKTNTYYFLLSTVIVLVCLNVLWILFAYRIIHESIPISISFFCMIIGILSAVIVSNLEAEQEKCPVLTLLNY